MGHEKEVSGVRDKSTQLEQRLSNFCGDWNARLDSLVSQDVVQCLMQDSRAELNRRIDELQVCMLEDMKTRVTAEDLLSLQQKLLTRVRAELTAAFRNESAAVTKLDEQLLLKDQVLR